MRKWCINGVVDIIQAPETLEKSGGRENYEIRHRGPAQRGQEHPV